MRARHTERCAERLHDLKELRARHVFRKHLKVLRGWLWSASAALPLTLRCLRRHERPRESDHTNRDSD
jgi:hypothetical protein